MDIFFVFAIPYTTIIYILENIDLLSSLRIDGVQSNVGSTTTVGSMSVNSFTIRELESRTDIDLKSIKFFFISFFCFHLKLQI